MKTPPITRIRRPAVLVVVLTTAALLASVVTGVATAAGAAPTPPFRQCPAVGQSPSCQILVVINADRSVSVLGDPGVTAYDGSDDTLVGVVNNSSAPAPAITVSGPATGLSQLDGDGLCTFGVPGCPFGPTGYEGPGTTIVTDPAIPDSAEIDFAGGLAAGASGYFSLEGALTAAQLTARQGTLGGGAGKFVYVALGDSYQSGEGAGFAVRPSATYRATAYGNGSNYLLPDGKTQDEDTLTPVLDPGGDGCHRALMNYAKINRDRFKPGADVVLIDRTCSGASIRPLKTPYPIAPVIDPAPGPQPSQIAQAVNELAAAGLTPADVNLVTVGMGGNDAGFPTIVQTCVGTSIVEALVRDAAKAAVAPPARDFADRAVKNLAGHVTCENIYGLISNDKIAGLATTEQTAQDAILQTFGKAEVFQNDYPSIVPSTNSIDNRCGGIRGTDIPFARTTVKRINDAIRSTVMPSGQQRRPKLHLIENEAQFGPNALCPGGSDPALANGVSAAAFNSLVVSIETLGAADLRKRTLAATDAATRLLGCFVAKNSVLPGFLTRCNLQQDTTEAINRFTDILNFLNVGQIATTVRSELASPAGSSDDTIAAGFDRANGLFHPNPAGISVLACDTLHTYQGTPTAGCTANPTSSNGTVNGVAAGLSPVASRVGQQIVLALGGFAARLPVHLRLFSTPIDLGQITAGDDGVVRTTVPLPPVGGGVHTLQIEGTGADGVQVTKQVLLQVPGRASGDYSTYLCCFNPEPATIAATAPREHISVTVGGVPLTDSTLAPDANGGVLVYVPSVDRLVDPSDLVIEARSDLTGKVIRDTIKPIPTAPSLWATSTGPAAISITGTGFQAAGRVHSEGGIQIIGTSTALTGGTEYATSLTTVGAPAKVVPAAAKTAAGQGGPPIPPIADYRPGGPVATSGVDYRAIPASSCRGGTWTPTPTETLTGVIYVPCGVTVSGSNQKIAATIVADGPIRITGAGISLGPDSPGAPSMITSATGSDAIAVTGTNTAIHGTAFAPAGTARVTGSRSTLECGTVASSIAVTGADVTAPMTGRCLAQ